MTWTFHSSAQGFCLATRDRVQTWLYSRPSVHLFPACATAKSLNAPTASMRNIAVACVSTYPAPQFAFILFSAFSPTFVRIPPRQLKVNPRKVRYQDRSTALLSWFTLSLRLRCIKWVMPSSTRSIIGAPLSGASSFDSPDGISFPLSRDSLGCFSDATSCLVIRMTLSSLNPLREPFRCSRCN